MAIRGTKPTSQATKERRGTDRPCRAPEVPVVDFPAVLDIPKPPSWCKGKDVRDEWERVARLLLVSRALTAADLTSLAHYCMLHGEVVGCWRRKVEVPTTRLAELRKQAESFGLNPAARSRVPVAGGQAENRFARNGARNKKNAAHGG